MRSAAVLSTLVVILGLGATAWMSAPASGTLAPSVAVHDGSDTSSAADKLPAAYARWRAEHEQNGGDSNLNLALRWHGALSSEHTTAEGTAHLDLIKGSISVDLHGLGEVGAVDVWLVDNQDGDGRSVKPEEGDRFLYVGAIEPDAAGDGALGKSIGAEPRTFEVDLMMVTRKDASPRETGLLFGSFPLFQRLYSAERGEGNSQKKGRRR